MSCESGCRTGVGESGEITRANRKDRMMCSEQGWLAQGGEHCSLNRQYSNRPDPFVSCVLPVTLTCRPDSSVQMSRFSLFRQKGARALWRSCSNVGTFRLLSALVRLASRCAGARLPLALADGEKMACAGGMNLGSPDPNLPLSSTTHLFSLMRST